MKFNIYLILFVISIFLLINYSTKKIFYPNNNIHIRSLKEDSEILHLLKFDFTTNHNPNESKDPITHLILNDVSIKIKVGTPIQTISSSLRFNDYLFYLSSPYINLLDWEDESNIYKNTTSKSYKFIFNDILFYKSLLEKGAKSNETFNFQTLDINNKKNENILIQNFTFYYSMKQNYNQSGGVVGLCLEDSNMNLHSGMNFLLQLKYNKAISYKTFFINYKSDESGELIIGAYPHEYWKAKYKYENYIDIRGYTETTYVIYGIIFDEINFGEYNLILNEENKRIMTADLRLEFGFIQAPGTFEKNITNVFIDNEKCKSFKTNQKDIYSTKLFGTDEYIYYICDEDYEIDKINSTISFTKKEMEYVFELDEKDLFRKRGNKKYFNIVFNTGYNFKNWIFGKPMFLKYKWVFDPDKKRMGIYTKEEIDSEDDDDYETNSWVLIIILIIISIVFLVVLAIFLYQLFIKIRRSRKNRKNEILDEFEYGIN